METGLAYAPEQRRRLTMPQRVNIPMKATGLLYPVKLDVLANGSREGEEYVFDPPVRIGPSTKVVLVIDGLRVCAEVRQPGGDVSYGWPSCPWPRAQ